MDYDKKTKPNLKAGCIVIDPKMQTIGLIYREKLNDFEFAKGHLKTGETITECAIRETAEETKHIAKPLFKVKPLLE